MCKLIPVRAPQVTVIPFVTLAHNVGGGLLRISNCKQGRGSHLYAVWYQEDHAPMYTTLYSIIVHIRHVQHLCVKILRSLADDPPSFSFSMRRARVHVRLLG
jgi:hypothetical protein